MRTSIQKAFAKIQEDLVFGTISKDQAKERLEGILLLAKIELNGQPHFDSVYAPAVKTAREILDLF